MRKDILNASKLHFEAHIEKHKVNVNNLLRNTVGEIGRASCRERV